MSDMHSKQRSFSIWLEEVKSVPPSSSLPKWELQNYFKEYAEDFNTATLPHIKYYDYDAYEMDQYSKQKSEQANAASGNSARADEAKHLQELKEKQRRKQQEELELAKSIMARSGKAEDFRRQKQLQAEMAHAFKRGDQETYRRLKAKLEPENK